MTSYPHGRQVGDRGRGDVVAVRWPQVPGPVGAMLVIVRDILVKDRPEVPLPGDQHLVGDLSPGCAHPVGCQKLASGCDLRIRERSGGRA